ncbi:hypothetical protein ACFWSJ_17425 [Streptomyces niveus]|uniref:hypothetical protein n=1 Tax=Streptomyces niveus TaxID=193462 RepID=UPI00364F2E8F
MLMAQEAEDYDPLAYRVVLHVTEAGHAEVFDAVRAVLGEWLSSKGYPWTPATGLSSVGDGTTLFFTSTYRENGSQQGMRAQLTEADTGRTWRTTVTAARSVPVRGGRPGVHIAVELECLLEPGSPWPRTNPPRLIRQLVERLPVVDGDMTLDSAPLRVGPRQVDELIDVLCDPARRLPVFTAVRPPGPADVGWERELDKLARRVCGVASLYVLDAEAASVFNHALTFHRVGPGSIRTYASQVDPASVADAGRHRVMSYRRLKNEPGAAYRILTRNGHAPAVRSSLPRTLSADAFPDIDPASWTGLRGAEETARRAVALESGDGPRPGAELRQRLRETSEALSDSLRQLGHLEAELRYERQRSQILGEQYQIAETGADAETVDHDHTARQLSYAEQSIRELQRRLTEVNAAQEAWRGIEVVDDPLSVEDFLDRLEALPYVEFSGDRGPALALDEQMKSSTWASKTWRAARALNDYGVRRAEGFDRNFREFCADPPSGVFTLPVHQVALRESDSVSTNPRMRAERELPVPPSVSLDRRVFMGAHLKLDHKGTVSPRLHFHDDTAGATGKIWIGYLGRHLTTTLSN